MKKVSKIEDGVLGNLLRSQLHHHEATNRNCEGFDADLANAYIEHALPLIQQTHYESHMAACADCRKLTVGLLRMATAEGVTVNLNTAPVEISALHWWQSWKGFALTLATPRVAFAAVALFALAIGLPWFLSNRTRNTANEAVHSYASDAATTPANNAPLADGSANTMPNATTSTTEKARSLASGSSSSQGESEASPTGGLLAIHQPPAESPSPAATVVEETPSQSKPETEAPTKEETAGKEARSEAAAPPTARTPAEGDKPIDKISPAEARELPRESKDSEPKMVVIKPGPVGAESGGKKGKATIRPDDAVTTTDDRADETPSRSVAAPSHSASLRSKNEVAKSRQKGTPEIKVHGKKFYFLNGVWTDKEYNAEKEMPVVPVVRDSDIYKELLSRHNGLKPFFDRFKEERAIVIYKGTVYKLTPAEASK